MSNLKLPRGNLTRGFSVLASGSERTLMADEHATEDRRRTLLGLRVRGKVRWLLFLNFGLACASLLQMERLLWFVRFSFESQCR